MSTATESAASTQDSQELTIKNAVIDAYSVTNRQGFLTVLLQVSYGTGESQVFGGHALYLPEQFENHRLVSPAGHFIHRLMTLTGVSELAQLPGRSIRVKATDQQIHAIGHIVADEWFSPEVDFAELIEADQKAIAAAEPTEAVEAVEAEVVAA